MPSRRSVLLGTGALIAGGGAVLGTGAFTTVQAERTVSVETAGDSGAFLGLNTISDSDNSNEFAQITDGTLEVTIDGVNLNAITHIDRVFQITNNGSDPVVLYLEEEPGDDNPDGNAIDFGARTDQLDISSPYDASDQPTANGIADGEIVDLSGPSGPGYGDIGVYLGTGNTLEIGLYIDTSDANLNDGLSESSDSDIGADELLMENLIVHADANAAENGNYQFVEADSSP